jgi:uncharacterized membrane protein YcaP (DUF421 family)
MSEHFHEWMRFFFGGDSWEEHITPVQVANRAIAVYIIGMVLVRIGKSRLISRASPLDVIVGFIIGSLLSRGITGHASISDTFIASAALVFAHWFVTRLTFHSHTLGKLLKGNSYLLVDDGRILWDNLSRSHFSEHDLMEAIRVKTNVEDLAQVHHAYKERNGEISVILKKQPCQ